MPVLSFRFEDGELRVPDRRLVEGRKGFCNLKYLHEHLQRGVNKPVVDTKRDPPIPTPTPNTADDLQKEAAPVTFRNY